LAPAFGRGQTGFRLLSQAVNRLEASPTTGLRGNGTRTPPGGHANESVTQDEAGGALQLRPACLEADGARQSADLPDPEWGAGPRRPRPRVEDRSLPSFLVVPSPGRALACPPSSSIGAAPWRVATVSRGGEADRVRRDRRERPRREGRERDNKSARKTAPCSTGCVTGEPSRSAAG